MNEPQLRSRYHRGRSAQRTVRPQLIRGTCPHQSGNRREDTGLTAERLTRPDRLTPQRERSHISPDIWRKRDSIRGQSPRKMLAGGRDTRNAARLTAPAMHRRRLRIKDGSGPPPAAPPQSLELAQPENPTPLLQRQRRSPHRITRPLPPWRNGCMRAPRRE